MTPVVGLLGRCYSVPFILCSLFLENFDCKMSVHTYYLLTVLTTFGSICSRFLTSKEAMACRRVGSVVVMILIGKH